MLPDIFVLRTHSKCLKVLTGGSYKSGHEMVVRRSLKCHARKTCRQPVRWPVLHNPLPSSPGVSISVDYFGPLPTTARGNSDILHFTDHFSRRADMFTAVSSTELTDEETANILVDGFIPR